MPFLIVFYYLLFISVRAFLPSLRVLVTSQEREEIIKIVSITKEMKVISKLLFNLLTFFKIYNKVQYNFKRLVLSKQVLAFHHLDRRYCRHQTRLQRVAQ